MTLKNRLINIIIAVVVLFVGLFAYHTFNHSNRVSADDNATTITFLGQTYDYRNIGQEYMTAQDYINADPDTHIATWGGKPIQLDNDGHNTHFIGHTPGVFHDLNKLKVGDPITVTDLEGNSKTYHVTQKLEVDDYGDIWNDRSDNVMSEIIGTGKREQVTFQTCESDVENWIIIAN